jgi:hypothetical protein
MTALMQYLTQSNWLAGVQFAIYLAVLYRLLDRSLRAWGLFGRRLELRQRVADPALDALARLCLGMGLLLTFSGLYGYIGSGSIRDQAALLLALGSSAVGYSAWTFCAIGAVVDAWRPAKTGLPPGIHDSEPVPFSGRTKMVQAPTVRDPEPVPFSERSDYEEYDDEQESVADSGGECGFVGGVADYADLAADQVFGGLDGYQRSADAAACDDARADSDLVGGVRPDWPLACDPPTADDGADPPAPGNNGWPKRRTGGDPFAV